MAQFLWRRKRCSKIPLGMVQMQPSHGSLLTDNQMVSRDTQERQNEAPCCWAGRRLLAKDRLCNKMGNQVKLENILDDIKTAGKQSKKHAALDQTPKSGNARGKGSLSLGDHRAFHNDPHCRTPGPLWGAGRACHPKKPH